MDSHELARAMQADAEFLLHRPVFEVPDSAERHCLFYWHEKEKFVAAVRATLPGKKDLSSADDVKFQPNGLKILQFWVYKSAVYRKVQEAKYECEPLLSPEEESLMEEVTREG